MAAKISKSHASKLRKEAMYTIVLGNSEGFETDSVIYFTGGSKHLFPN